MTHSDDRKLAGHAHLSELYFIQEASKARGPLGFIGFSRTFFYGPVAKVCVSSAREDIHG